MPALAVSPTAQAASAVLIIRPMTRAALAMPPRFSRYRRQASRRLWCPLRLHWSPADRRYDQCRSQGEGIGEPLPYPAANFVARPPVPPFARMNQSIASWAPAGVATGATLEPPRPTFSPPQ